MADLDFARLSPVQTAANPGVPTIASATTIAPTTFLSFISGTLALTTITPFVSGPHQIVLIFTSATPGIIATTGNIVRSTTLTIQNVPYYFVYDPLTAKYYVNIAG